MPAPTAIEMSEVVQPDAVPGAPVAVDVARPAAAQVAPAVIPAPTPTAVAQAASAAAFAPAAAPEVPAAALAPAPASVPPAPTNVGAAASGAPIVAAPSPQVPAASDQPKAPTVQAVNPALFAEDVVNILLGIWHPLSYSYHYDYKGTELSEYKETCFTSCQPESYAKFVLKQAIACIGTGQPLLIFMQELYKHLLATEKNMWREKDTPDQHLPEILERRINSFKQAFDTLMVRNFVFDAVAVLLGPAIPEYKYVYSEFKNFSEIRNFRDHFGKLEDYFNTTLALLTRFTSTYNIPLSWDQLKTQFAEACVQAKNIMDYLRINHRLESIPLQERWRTRLFDKETIKDMFNKAVDDHQQPLGAPLAPIPDAPSPEPERAAAPADAAPKQAFDASTMAENFASDAVAVLLGPILPKHKYTCSELEEFSKKDPLEFVHEEQYLCCALESILNSFRTFTSHYNIPLSWDMLKTQFAKTCARVREEYLDHRPIPEKNQWRAGLLINIEPRFNRLVDKYTQPSRMPAPIPRPMKDRGSKSAAPDTTPKTRIEKNSPLETVVEKGCVNYCRTTVEDNRETICNGVAKALSATPDSTDIEKLLTKIVAKVAQNYPDDKLNIDSYYDQVMIQVALMKSQPDALLDSRAESLAGPAPRDPQADLTETIHQQLSAIFAYFEKNELDASKKITEQKEDLVDLLTLVQKSADYTDFNQKHPSKGKSPAFFADEYEKNRAPLLRTIYNFTEGQWDQLKKAVNDSLNKLAETSKRLVTDNLILKIQRELSALPASVRPGT